MKKVLCGLFVGLGVIVLAGCGSENTAKAGGDVNFSQGGERMNLSIIKDDRYSNEYIVVRYNNSGGVAVIKRDKN